MIDWHAKFDEANEMGADRFGTLWLRATQEAVAMFREAGYGDELERYYRLRAALSRALFRSLAAATQHPNNLARAKQLIERAREEQR